MVTTVDFHRMSSADFLAVASILRHRSETRSEAKFPYLALWESINSIIHDFGYVDVELHAQFPGAPPLQKENETFDDAGDISKGYSMAPLIALAYEEESLEEGKSPSMLCFRFEDKHIYSSIFLKIFVAALEDDEDMDATDRLHSSMN